MGIVLGAGGVVGQAYQAGVLASLRHDLGWDPRDADLIVGTSAGSVTGTLLRLGVGADDLAAWAVDAPLTIAGAELTRPLRERVPEFPSMTAADLLRPWRLPRPALLGRAARRPWSIRPSVAAMTLLPSGRFDLLTHTSIFDDVAGGAFPAGLWMCAVRRDDGRRVVFGRPGAPGATVGQAVASSCAIPGYFAPVTIGRGQYFDGGVHSSTNADVLRAADLDLVIVVASMSAARGRAASADALFRWSVHQRLRREVKQLRKAGTEVAIFEPGAHAIAAMGLNAMAVDRSDRVVQAAFIETGRQSAMSSAVLEPINSRAA